MRTEKDSMGEMVVPDDALWGASTQRAVLNFPISGRPMPPAFLRGLGLVKLAAAQTNTALGKLAPEKSRFIQQAAREIADGQHVAHFPVDVFQTGSGTSTNINANEVIARRAAQLAAVGGAAVSVHPNDDVNLGQSSNDVIPTALHLSVAVALHRDLTPALATLAVALEQKSAAFADIVKIGRTHLMDAVPMTQGQAFGAFAHQAAHGIDRIKACMPRLLLLPQGGTAVGTGLNTPVGFDSKFCEHISVLTGQPFAPNPCKFEGMGTHDALVEVSGVLNVIAVSLTKLANDVRLLGSGPRCGFGELLIPDDGLTSSIMPGKRNPTIAEVLAQAAMQVIGNHSTITMAGASSLFELNVAKPVLISNLLQSIDVLSHSVTIFTEKLLKDLDLDREKLQSNIDHSLLIATALNPLLGYDVVAQITRKAAAEGISPKAAALALGVISAGEYDAHVQPKMMALPK